MKLPSIHCCPLDKYCRSLGSKDDPMPWRLHVRTSKWFYTLALTPNARVQKDWTDHKLVWFRRDHVEEINENS